jgi:Fur family peroxide stress response transcriptional regulator
MTTAQLLLEGLRRAGCRITAQRRAICLYLAAANQHPTPDTVVAALAGQQPALSRATVYNTLNTLARLGLITPIDVGDQATHYETNQAPHINLICQRCHQVIDLPAEALAPALQQWIEQSTGFTTSTMQVQALGLCRTCQEQERYDHPVAESIA